jgi:predicted AlkP superfamily pyrophosphatase or phosphodiesterase
MKSRFLYIALAALLIAPATAQNRNRHVVVISLDGFPAVRLNDPALPAPVLRKLMKEGAAAESMTPVNPTVTWPNHTSIVTGVGPERHGLLYNGLPVRPGEGKPLRIEPWVDKKELVQAPTVYDAARAAGLTTAEVDWVAIYPASSVNFAFPEVPKPEGAIEREMVAAGLISEDELRNWSRHAITTHDEFWTRAAVHIIEKHKPNLLLFHLLVTDSVQHAYGTNTLAGNTALILADRQVQRVLDALGRAGIRNSTTVIIVSDHGFKSYSKLIHPNAVLRAKGLLRGAGDAMDCDAWVIPEGGTANVYITRESRRAESLRAIEAAFRAVPGIAKVILPAEYAQYGYPNLGKQPRMSDMVLAAEPGYAFDAVANGEAVTNIPAGAVRGAHGYLNSDPELLSILVAAGAGIKPGARLGAVPNVDVAATIARLLGVNLPGIDGKPLVEMLR